MGISKTKRPKVSNSIEGATPMVEEELTDDGASGVDAKIIRLRGQRSNEIPDGAMGERSP